MTADVAIAAEVDDGAGTAAAAPPPPRAPAVARGWWAGAIVTMVVAVGPTVLWPGDTPWMLDEPAVVANACRANDEGRLATRGLSGGFALNYGPLPTHIYQGLLKLTRDDPVMLVMLRGILCAGAIGLGLVWLSRTLRLSPWFAAALVAGPNLWIHARVAWDASFTMPLGTLGLAAYASFLAARRGWKLTLAGACLTSLAFIHPQALPLLGAVALHFVAREGRSWLRYGPWGLAGAALIVWLNWGYIVETFLILTVRSSSLVSAGHMSGTSRAEALAGPLIGGGRIFASELFMDWAGEPRGPRWIVETLIFLTGLAVPLVWGGIVVAAVGVARRLIARRACAEADDPRAAATAAARVEVMGIALAALLMQVGLYGVMRVPTLPQYLFGTMVVHALFAWWAVEALSRWRLRLAATLIYALPAAAVTTWMILQVHAHGWQRDKLSPTLANQLEVVRALNRYSDDEAWTNVRVYRFTHPHALWALRLLTRSEREALGDDDARPRSCGLIIRYKDGPAAWNAQVEVVEARSPEDVPRDTRRVALDYPW